MSINDYYIIPIGLLNNTLLDHVVQSKESARKNLAGTKCLVKTYHGVKNHPALAAHKKYSHEEILVEVPKPEWVESYI